MTTDSMTRVRKWTQNFLDSDNELMVHVGRNFEYLLNHVDEYESGDLSHSDFPEFDEGTNTLLRACVSFGTMFPCNHTTLYQVTDENGEFIALYGIESNAQGRTLDEDGLVVEEITPIGRDPREFAEKFNNTPGEGAQHIGDVFTFICDNELDYISGNILPDEFPRFDENTKWLIGYSIMFGMLWEVSYPSLHGVFDKDGVLKKIFWAKSDAQSEASDLQHIRRLSVTDGDLDAESIDGLLKTPNGDEADMFKD